MLTEILIVIALILVNGALAMSELAVVSARPARLKAMVESGNRGAAVALRLAEEPGKFLSSVQIGITAVGILSGAFSGATLGVRLAAFMAAEGVDPDLADTLGVALVVVILTYLSLILGELVPKQIALRNPEGMAARVAPVMRVIAALAAPLVWFLDISGRLILRLLGQESEGKSRMTDEEVRVLLTEAHDDGVIEKDEREMLSGVMRLADRSARGLMTPRREVDMVVAGMPEAELMAEVRRIGRPRIPVRAAEGEDVVGVLYLTDVVAALSEGRPVEAADLMRQVPVVLESADALSVIETLRNSPNHMALVYDEYGSFEGLITTGDILEAITGSFQDEVSEEPPIAERQDGSLLVAGWMPADEFCDKIGIPRDVAGDYATVAGIVLHNLQRLPQLGDVFTVAGYRFEVIDMDGRKVDKILVSRT